MNSQCIPRSPKGRAHALPLPLFLRSFLHPMHVICAPFGSDTRAYGEWIHQPWPKPVRVNDQATWNRSTRRAGVRGGARAGRPSCVRMLAWPGKSAFFGFSLTALAQRHECELLLMSECAMVRSWPYLVVHSSTSNRIRRSASSSKAAARQCRPWTSVACPKEPFA
jgi:hypothetical protein